MNHDRLYEGRLTAVGASLWLAAAMLANGAAMAQSGSCSTTQYVDANGNPVIGPPTTTVGVVPELCVPWTSGDAGQECVVNLGYDFGHKIDGWDSNIGGDYSGACDGKGSCTLDPSLNNTITISNNDGTYFDWASSPFSIGAVVVKGGPNANVFTYDPAASADTDLYSPLNPNTGNPREVSHVSFCWNEGGDVCYEEETAWAIGQPYGKNWAMYVDYAACDADDGLVDGVCTVDLRADGGDGVGLYAGTATLEPSGSEVKITINLDNTFIFYYDLGDDEEDENLKVQDYDMPPKGNARPGRFAHKKSVPVGSTTAYILVPTNLYYGIHLDVAYEVPCG